MEAAQSDLVDWYKLETEFFEDHVRHTRYVEKGGNMYKKVNEDWSNCEELGAGGFGVVVKQVRGTTAHYRAVKTIDKRRLPRGFDYSRELLIMAILAKHPLLFVKFLGWFEKPETVYIAMEYLPEGDLRKHLGSPLQQETVRAISKQILEGLKVMHQKGIAHRDLKPENIFVVSMSPVRVKLGDFGISKRIQTKGTTVLCTQVSTQSYAAPEVQGSDPNSETSVYTNSVDIWSLGCVIYELLVGTQLFDTEREVSRYFFGLRPFPKDKLKELPIPTDDAGISLLKSMLSIKPEDRPTVADALGNAWLAGLESDEEDSGDDHEMTQSGNEGTCSGEDVALGTKSEIGTGMMMRGAEGTAGPPYSANMSPKPPASDLPTPDPYRGGGAQPTPGTSGFDSPTARVGDWQTYPARQTSFGSGDSRMLEAPNASGEGGGSWGGPTIDPMKNPNTQTTYNAGRNPNAGWNPNQNPNAGWNPNQNPNANWNPNQNPNQNPNANWNPNQNPNASWNPNQNPNAGGNPNQNPNTSSNPNWNPNVNSNSNQNPNLAWMLKAGGNPNIGWNPNAGGNRNLGQNPNRLVAGHSLG